ncbi:hypothetical protein BASA61_002966 [Batrachochytrium salamandrivorans]|nr:hypothetical protein BASA61_002966 [Batrachochytrium salamandrivorans]
MSNTLAHPTSISSRHDRIQPISEQPIPSTAQSGIASRPGYPVSCFGNLFILLKTGLVEPRQISNPFTTPQDPSFHSPVSHSPHPLSSTTLSEPSRRSRLAEQSVSFSPSHTQSLCNPCEPTVQPIRNTTGPQPISNRSPILTMAESTPPHFLNLENHPVVVFAHSARPTHPNPLWMSQHRSRRVPPQVNVPLQSQKNQIATQTR